MTMRAVRITSSGSSTPSRPPTSGCSHSAKVSAASPYTKQMLDELKRAGVKATFFLIGQNAERYPSIVRRIWNEGHEIGNHTFTHPNIGAVSASQARLE